MNKIILAIGTIALISTKIMAGPKCDEAASYLATHKSDIISLIDREVGYPQGYDHDWRNADETRLNVLRTALSKDLTRLEQKIKANDEYGCSLNTNLVKDGVNSLQTTMSDLLEVIGKWIATNR